MQYDPKDMFVVRCVSLLFDNGQFTYILHGYIIGIGTILPQCPWSNPEEYRLWYPIKFTRNLNHNHKKTKHTLKPQGCYNSNFVVINGTEDCHNNNVQCHHCKSCHNAKLCHHWSSVMTKFGIMATLNFQRNKATCILHGMYFVWWWWSLSFLWNAASICW